MLQQTRHVLDPKKNYSEQEVALLDNLFTPECQGDARKSALKAGLHGQQVTRTITKLRNEILEVTRAYLATLAPQAAAKLGEILAHPTRPGHSHALKAVDGVLNRIGMSPSQTHEVSVEHRGVVELPAKQPRQVIEGNVEDANVVADESNNNAA